MKTGLKFLLFIAIVLVSPVDAREKIVEITFSGLTKTKPGYLKQFIHSEIGSDYDSLTVSNDAQNLRNLQLFLGVDVTSLDTLGGKRIVFQCEELVTLLPIVNFGGVTDNFWFQLGGVDYNWLGKGNTLGGYYRYYDRHSFEFSLKMPYLLGRYWGFSTNLAKFSTIEPAYFETGATDYNVDHWGFLGFVRYNFSLFTTIEFGGGYLYERYEKNTSRTGAIAPGPDLLDFDKYLLKLTLTHNNIDYFYHYLNGFAGELNLETVKTVGEPALFWKVLNIYKFFFQSGQRGNLAFRLRTGIATNKNSPFVPFILDNFITVRGAGNRVSRGTAELTLNSEYRRTFLEDRSVVVQGVAFLDMSAWRPAGGDLSEMFNNENSVRFTGLGLRFHLRKINNFVFRIDYGISLPFDDSHGVVFGAGQYF